MEGHWETVQSDPKARIQLIISMTVELYEYVVMLYALANAR